MFDLNAHDKTHFEQVAILVLLLADIYFISKYGLYFFIKYFNDDLPF